MPSNSSLVVRREGALVLATLNRPDRLNALNKDIFDELKRLLDVLETEKTNHVMILTGSGDKSFCVGADLKERQGMNEKDVLLRLESVRSLYQRIEKLPFPVIAAINGSALGGGTEIALACDLRIASENALFGLPEVDLAIIPGTGGTQRLPRIVGMARAMEWILLAKRLTAAEALQYGLVNAVVPAGQSLAQAKVWAQKMMEAGPLAIRQAKFAIRSGMDLPLDKALVLETEAYRTCLYSKDRLEGLKAFVEKRKPAYRGE